MISVMLFLALFVIVVFGGLAAIFSVIGSPILWGLFGFLIFFIPVAVDAAIDVLEREERS